LDANIKERLSKRAVVKRSGSAKCFFKEKVTPKRTY